MEVKYVGSWSQHVLVLRWMEMMKARAVTDSKSDAAGGKQFFSLTARLH